MTKKAFFITGTDTHVGKTLVTGGLLIAAKQMGLSTAALKPVASGCDMTDAGLRNQDALILHANITQTLTYEQINPYAFAEPIAPHIAAQRAKRSVSVDRLVGFCRGVLSSADLTLIEGAGGWRVPINAKETLADLARQLQTPVILVVAVRLGCINHALLTCEAILRDGLPLAGWVANCTDNTMPAMEENIQSLMNRIPAPCLGVIPYLENPSPADAVHFFNTPELKMVFDRSQQ